MAEGDVDAKPVKNANEALKDKMYTLAKKFTKEMIDCKGEGETSIDKVENRIKTTTEDNCGESGAENGTISVSAEDIAETANNFSPSV